MNSIKYTKIGNEAVGFGLGSYNSVVAIRNGNEALCLVGEGRAYTPAGGKKTLKTIVETTIEGRCYYWKSINN